MADPNRNVVLVTVDSLRADHCGFLGAEEVETPNMDALAGDGVVFENAIAPGPRTPISVPESMTGTPMAPLDDCPDEERARHIAAHVAGTQTLPEAFSERGYTTAAVNANPWTSSWTDFDDLFDSFVDRTDVTEESPTVRTLLSVLGGTHAGTMALWAGRWVHGSQFFSQWPTLYGDVAQFVESLPEPYFLWIFLMDTHNPYLVPRPYRHESSTLGMYYSLVRANQFLTHDEGDSAIRTTVPRHVHEGVRRAYRDAVRSVDAFVGRLRDDVGEETVVALHADHGEAFGEHGTYGHQQRLFEENVHVPFVVTDPSASAGGRRVTEPLSLRSLPSTLLAVATDDGAVDDCTESRVVARTQDGRAIAVRSETAKYVRRDGTERLYALEADPGERRDLLAAEGGDADASRFRATAEAFEETVPARPTRTGETRPEVSAARAQLLEDLGYR